jgi:hypothetical protein
MLLLLDLLIKYGPGTRARRNMSGPYKIYVPNNSTNNTYHLNTSLDHK